MYLEVNFITILTMYDTLAYHQSQAGEMRKTYWSCVFWEGFLLPEYTSGYQGTERLRSLFPKINSGIYFKNLNFHKSKINSEGKLEFIHKIEKLEPECFVNYKNNKMTVTKTQTLFVYYQTNSITFPWYLWINTKNIILKTSFTWKFASLIKFTFLVMAT